MSKVRHRRPICKYYTMLCMLKVYKKKIDEYALNQIVRIHLNECIEIATLCISNKWEIFSNCNYVNSAKRKD